MDFAYAPDLVRLAYTHAYPVWPASRQRRPSAPEGGLIGAGGQSRFVAADRFQAEEESWRLAPTQEFDPGWHGAAITAPRDGALLGLLQVDNGQARLLRLPAGEKAR